MFKIKVWIVIKPFLYCIGFDLCENKSGLYNYQN